MIGYEPTVEGMAIVTGQTFSHYFHVTEDDPFPAETVVVLKIYNKSGTTQLGAWPAVLVEEGGAQIQITSDDLADIPNGASFRVYVTYPDTQSLCWYRGPVTRRF